MLYAALWRALPGPTPVRVLLALLLVDNTVDPQPNGAPSAYHCTTSTPPGASA
jgi:hypothetical protein